MVDIGGYGKLWQKTEGRAVFYELAEIGGSGLAGLIASRATNSRPPTASCPRPARTVCCAHD